MLVRSERGAQHLRYGHFACFLPRVNPSQIFKSFHAPFSRLTDAIPVTQRDCGAGVTGLIMTAADGERQNGDVWRFYSVEESVRASPVHRRTAGEREPSGSLCSFSLNLGWSRSRVNYRGWLESRVTRQEQGGCQDVVILPCSVNQTHEERHLLLTKVFLQSQQ